MRMPLPALIAGVAAAALLSSCHDERGAADGVVYRTSSLDVPRVARRIAFGSIITDEHETRSPQTGDPGLEVTVSEEGSKGTFAVFKAPTEEHLKGMVRGIDNLLRSMKAAGGKAPSWCYLAEQDFFFDCQLMPPELREEFKRRFRKALEQPKPETMEGGEEE